MRNGKEKKKTGQATASKKSKRTGDPNRKFLGSEKNFNDIFFQYYN